MKKFLVEQLKMKICQTKSQLNYYTKQLLENSRKERYSYFIDNIQGADLFDLELVSIVNTGICFSLCVIDIFSKYTWDFPLKDQKCITINNTFQKNLKESNRTPNKIWVNKGSKFYNKSRK